MESKFFDEFIVPNPAQNEKKRVNAARNFLTIDLSLQVQKVFFVVVVAHLVLHDIISLKILYAGKIKTVWNEVVRWLWVDSGNHWNSRFDDIFPFCLETYASKMRIRMKLNRSAILWMKCVELMRRQPLRRGQWRWWRRFYVFVIFSLIFDIRSNLTFKRISALIFLSHLSIVVAVATFAFIARLAALMQEGGFFSPFVCLNIAFWCESVVDHVAHAKDMSVWVSSFPSSFRDKLINFNGSNWQQESGNRPPHIYWLSLLCARLLFAQK